MRNSFIPALNMIGSSAYTNCVKIGLGPAPHVFVQAGEIVGDRAEPGHDTVEVTPRSFGALVLFEKIAIAPIGLVFLYHNDKLPLSSRTVA